MSSRGDAKLYLEVKTVTCVKTMGSTKIGLFPSGNKSPRAQRHLEDLMEVVKEGHQAVVLFVVMGGDCTAVGPHSKNDARFASLLKEAEETGVMILGICIELKVSQREKSCSFVLRRLLDVVLDPPPNID